MKNLHLPLKTKWFEMTKQRIKHEDYREINEYWINRLLEYWNGVKIGNDNATNIIDNLKCGTIVVKHFDINILTLGYPKLTDYERILKLEHKGIEIRTGNPEWGAEPDKLYLVIKHGEFI